MPSRRDLLRTATLATALIGAEQSPAQTSSKTMIGVPFQARNTVRMGLIGAGGRGEGMLKNFLGVEGLQVNAICDPVKSHAQEAQARVGSAGQKAPALYTDGDHAWEAMLRRDDLDFVYVATPWEWHVPVAVEAMKQGKHACIEVPAATTLEDCWKLVDTSESTRMHCIMCENCCYGENELMVLNMVRDGVLGDLIHGAGGYIHDLRRILFADTGEGLWRRAPHTSHNGNLYPTHGLGPVANYMEINRGDRFDYLVSMSSRERGLDAWREANVPKDSPKWKEKYICGDRNVSLIKTANGLTVTLEHDVVNPTPYDRINLIAGSKGVFRDYPPRIYLDNPKEEQFTSLDAYKERYEHTLWKRQGELARSLGGHGGMDFLMVFRLIECMKKGLVPEMDVYDAAALCAPGPLSEASVAQGSAPQPFPDFTRGLWKTKRISVV